MLKYKILKWRAKISFMALCKCQTIQEMLLRQILRSFLALATSNKMKISIIELYRQQDRVQNNFYKLSIKNSLRYIGQMNENEHLTNELVCLDKMKVNDNNLIMNLTYFLDDKFKVEKPRV